MIQAGNPGNSTRLLADIRRLRLTVRVLLLSIVVISIDGPVNGAELQPGIKFVNGHWYNGAGFDYVTRYVANGKISWSSIESIEKVIDLQGAYVVPAFGEAHSHRPANIERVHQDSAQFLGDGIFYVLNHGSLAKHHAAFVDALNNSDSVDVVFANAIVSSSQSHSVELWQRLIDRGAFPNTEMDELDGEAYVIVDSKADLDSRWPTVLSARPDFIKIMLQHSDEFELRNGDDAYFGHSGLNPDLVPEIVKRASDEGLRVSAHIESAADFRLAVSAGVNIIAHLPGYDVASGDSMQRYALTNEDAEIAAGKGVVVVTTTLLSKDRAEQEPERLAQMNANHIANLRLLRDAGARIAIGSDQFSKNSIDELINLAALGVFKNETLLNLISSVTPRTIFPHRKIGNLVHGAEADFIVLADNPLDDIENIRKISMRFKNGMPLEQ